MATAILDAQTVILGLTPHQKVDLTKRLTMRNPKFDLIAKYSPYGITPFTQETEYLCDAEELENGCLVVPRGCPLPPLTKITDRRVTRFALWPRERVSLMSEQIRAVRAFKRSSGNGVIVLPPSGGKTNVALVIARALHQRTLVLTHRTSILKAWIDDALRMFGMTGPPSFRIIQGGKWELGRLLTLAMVQTVSRRLQDHPEFFSDFGLVIIDETHIAPCKMVVNVIRKIRSRYMLGISATPSRSDGMHPRLFWNIGPVVYNGETPSDLTMPVKVIPVQTGFVYTASKDRLFDFHTCMAYVTADAHRNKLLIQYVVREYKSKHSCLVLTRRVDHARWLGEALRQAGVDNRVLTGVGKRKEVEEVIDLSEKGVLRCVVGTDSLLQEGVSCRRWDRLFLTTSTKWWGNLLQKLGRIRRVHPQKKDAICYDFVDGLVPVLYRHWMKRLAGYRKFPEVSVLDFGSRS